MVLPHLDWDKISPKPTDIIEILLLSTLEWEILSVPRGINNHWKNIRIIVFLNEDTVKCLIDLVIDQHLRPERKCWLSSLVNIGSFGSLSVFSSNDQLLSFLLSQLTSILF